MKSHETNLKLQAWLDGELPAGEAAEFEKSLAGDAEMQALLGELRRTKARAAYVEQLRKQAKINIRLMPPSAQVDVAKAYAAACTPDFFLFDAEMTLVYRGQLDDSRPRRGDSGNDLPVTGKDLRAAMDAVIAGKRPDTNQRFSIGCNIKWKE